MTLRLRARLMLGGGIAAALMLGTPAPAANLSGRIFLGSEILDVNVLETDDQPSGPLRDSRVVRSGTGAAGIGQASAAYDVTFGRIRVRSAVSVEAAGTLADGLSIDSGASGNGAWHDTLTIVNPGLTGTQGTFRPRLRITGLVTGSSSGVDRMLSSYVESGFGVDVVVSTSNGGTFQQRYGGCRNLSPTGSGPCADYGDPFGLWTLDPVAFAFGTPFNVDVTASAGVFLRTVEGGTGDASANLGSTIAWEGITQVLDANGVPVTDFAVVSLTGTDYATVVPEPSTGSLVAAGVTWLGKLRRRSRGSASFVPTDLEARQTPDQE